MPQWPSVLIFDVDVLEAEEEVEEGRLLVCNIELLVVDVELFREDEELLVEEEILWVVEVDMKDDREDEVITVNITDEEDGNNEVFCVEDEERVDEVVIIEE